VSTPSGYDDDPYAAQNQGNADAEEAWNTERIALYRELGLTDAEIGRLGDLLHVYGEKVNALVIQGDSIRAFNPDDEGDELQKKVHAVEEEYRRQVEDVMGEERFERAAAFQEAFNESTPRRFGGNVRFTGF
jgi:hypothetical protein